MTPEDRAAITDLPARYARAADRCDWAAVRAVYHPDAVLDHGAYAGDVEGFVAFVQGRRDGIVHSAHYVSNVLVDPLAADRVALEVYGFAVQSFAEPSPFVPDGSAGARFRSTYRTVDLVERRSGRWAIAEAHLVLGELEVEHLAQAPRPRDGLTQRPGTDDPLYELVERWRRA